jgi:hypothetical protein
MNDKTSLAAAGAANSRRSQIAQFSSVLALGISFLALAVGAYQTRLMQEQARASVWPYMSIGKNEDAVPGRESFTWRADNNGVGPAKVQSVQVFLDGTPYRSWQEIFAKLAPEQEFHGGTSSLNGIVLPPSLNRETTIEMVKPDTPERAKVFQEAQKRILIEVCYCSVYDECWIARSLMPGNEAVPGCETRGKLQFNQ